MTMRNLHLLLICLLLSGLHLASGETVPPTHQEAFSSSTYEIYGESEEEVVRDACIRAVKGSIGRICFSDHMLRGRTVLDPYIDQNFSNFISRSEVNVSEVRGGRRYVETDVIVDNQKVYQDLNQKKFLYEPALRPVFYIFLSEKYDGNNAPAVGRQRILEMIGERQYRYLYAEHADDPNVPWTQKREKIIAPPIPSQDPTESAEALEAAIREAQRNEVEVFIGGKIHSETTREEKVYYNGYTFVRTICELSIIRADTGEILTTSHTVTTGGHVAAREAVRDASLLAISEIMPALFEEYESVWPALMHREADLRVMVINLDSENYDLLKEILKGASPQTEVFTRSYYGRVAVLTIRSDRSLKDFTRLLRSTTFPEFSTSYPRAGESVLRFLQD